MYEVKRGLGGQGRERCGCDGEMQGYVGTMRTYAWHKIGKVAGKDTKGVKKGEGNRKGYKGCEKGAGKDIQRV